MLAEIALVLVVAHIVMHALLGMFGPAGAPCATERDVELMVQRIRRRPKAKYLKRMRNEAFQSALPRVFSAEIGRDQTPFPASRDNERDRALFGAFLSSFNKQVPESWRPELDAIMSHWLTLLSDQEKTFYSEELARLLAPNKETSDHIQRRQAFLQKFYASYTVPVPCKLAWQEKPAVDTTI